MIWVRSKISVNEIKAYEIIEKKIQENQKTLKVNENP